MWDKFSRAHGLNSIPYQYDTRCIQAVIFLLVCVHFEKFTTEGKWKLITMLIFFELKLSAKEFKKQINKHHKNENYVCTIWMKTVRGKMKNLHIH